VPRNRAGHADASRPAPACRAPAHLRPRRSPRVSMLHCIPPCWSPLTPRYGYPLGLVAVSAIPGSRERARVQRETRVQRRTYHVESVTSALPAMADTRLAARSHCARARVVTLRYPDCRS
jgi:hypothetical protein